MTEYVALVNSTNQNAPFSLCTVGITRPDANYHIVNRNRMTTEFDFIISGKGVVRCNNIEYRLAAGDVYHLPFGCSFESFSDRNEPWTKIWVSAYGELLPSILRAYRLNLTVHFPKTSLYHHFKKILRVCRDDLLTIEQKEDATSLLLHGLISDLYKLTRDNESLIAAGGSDAAVLKSYLDNHVCEDIRISDLSALIFKSDSQTIRIFEKAFGVTPYRYLLQLRIASARQLLSNTNMSVKSIAGDLGFSNEHYFSYLFNQKVGKTPIEYRKACHELQDE